MRGGLFSVALSVSSRFPGVTWHIALGARTFLCYEITATASVDSEHRIAYFGLSWNSKATRMLAISCEIDASFLYEPAWCQVHAHHHDANHSQFLHCFPCARPKRQSFEAVVFSSLAPADKAHFCVF